MGRIRTEFQIDKRLLWTPFDSGSRNTYITAGASRGLKRLPLKTVRKVGLGGRHHSLQTLCLIEGTIDGRSIDTEAYVIKDLGQDEAGRPIDILFGTLAMQKWGIRLVPEDERLDLTHYPKEFLEY